MKKLTALLLILAVVLSLAACGGGSAGGGGSTESGSGKNSKAQTLQLGEKVETEPMTFGFDTAYIAPSTARKMSYNSAAEGMKYFCVLGSLANNTNSEINLYSVFMEMIFNGEYSYRALPFVEYGNRGSTSLPTMMEGTFILYAEIPDALVEKLSACTLRMSFDPDLKKAPSEFKDGSLRFELALDEDACNTAKQGPVFDMEYYEECPVLPTPESYGYVHQGSRSQHKTGGVVDKTTYIYSAIGQMDMKDIAANYLDQLRALGLRVQDGAEGSEIYWEGILLATVEINSSLKVILPGGNEQMSFENGVIVAPPQESEAPALALGDPIETDYLELNLSSTGITYELKSGSDKSGRYRYYSALDGSPYFYLQGTFKNTGGKPVDITRAYIQFTFDDTYNYQGSMTGFVDGTQIFVEEINPLATVNCYIYAPIPKELLDSYEVCKVRIGFDRDFAIRTVTQEGLPMFSKCDDVFVMRVTRK